MQFRLGSHRAGRERHQSALKVEATARSPYGTGCADGTDTVIAFRPTVSLHFRFNRYVNLEARYPLLKVNESSNTDLVWENSEHLVAVGVRF